MSTFTFSRSTFTTSPSPPLFLAVTWQLYRFPCHSLTHSLTDWLPVLKNTTKEHSERLVTLETCYQSDEETWPDKQKDNDNDKDNDKDNDNNKDIWGTPSISDPRDFWPLRHLIRVIRRHELTNKKTLPKTKTMTMTNAMTKTLREHPQRAALETCNLWNIGPEWWGEMTWPTKRQLQRQRQWQLQGQ